MNRRLSRGVLVLVYACLLTFLGCSASGDAPSSSIDAGKEPDHVRFDPTVARFPRPSKSLTLAPDWQPPAPTRTQPVQQKPRVQPPTHWGATLPALGRQPSDAEFRVSSGLPEPLRPVPGASTPAESEALAAALRQPWREDQRLEAIERFLEAYPASRWAPGLHLNLGALFFDRGYFQSALAHWKAGWEIAKDGKDGVSLDFANLCLAELAKMNARIGRVTEVEPLLAAAEARTLMGAARVKIESAAEGVWMMRHQPGISFRCGPYALASLAHEQTTPEALKKTAAFLAKTQSPLTGFSIPEVHRMSRELGLKLQIAKREVGAPVIVPAVVHWKLSHFGALIREEKGKLLLRDSTFGRDMWLTSKALDREASGYFLVPSGRLPPGWSPATTAETADLYGKGYASVIDPDRTAEFDHQVGGTRQCKAMATYRFHTLAASLHVEDTPISYSPAYGPEIKVRLAYNQRENSPQLSAEQTNFGPQFVSNWVSHFKRDTEDTQIRAGGGIVIIQHFTVPGTGPIARSMLGELFADVGSDKYRLDLPDGSRQYYEQTIALADPNDPGDNTPPNVYLSRIVDPQGNQVSIEYDIELPTRIRRIIDATGGATDYHYDYPNEPYLVTSIDDPFSRTATFSYAMVAGKVRLQSTEDPYGIVSSFTYNDAGEMSSMTTPYGTTTFKMSEAYVHTGQSLIRYVQATDPLGQTERVEYNAESAAAISSPLESPPPSASVVNYAAGFNTWRNSFYWDKLTMKLFPYNYEKAHVYHWVHGDNNAVTAILESERPPLENRVFYNYPDQEYPYQPGRLGYPSTVARVVKDAAGNNQTRAVRATYNQRANVTKTIDPIGRETTLDYDANDVDVLVVKQKTGSSANETLASYSYAGAPPHRPASVTDGAGKTTGFTYVAATGQLQTITNAKGEVTTFTYETNTSSPELGRLLSITGDTPGGNRSFTYDSYGRVRTATDSEGYTLTYDYDALDRVRTITHPDATFEQLEYEDHSLVATRDRWGRWTRHMYNGNEQRVVTQDPAQRTTQFEWCRCGQLRRFVDGNGNITEWQRDEASRVTKKIHADGSFEAYTYDPAGRLSTTADVMGRAVTYTYGLDDRVAKVDYSDPSTPDVTYAYDPWYPRLTSRVDGSGTTTSIN